MYMLAKVKKKLMYRSRICDIKCPNLYAPKILLKFHI